MAAHDYWRVSFLDSQGGGYPACADIQFRPTPGTAVTPSGGVASYENVLYGAPGDVFDGNPATGVVSGGGSNWMEYHYAAGTGPSVLELSLQSHHDYYANEGPKNITVDWSDDGATWTTQATINCGGAWGSNETRFFEVIEEIYTRSIDTGDGPWHDLAGIVIRQVIQGGSIANYNGDIQIAFVGATDGSVCGYEEAYFGNGTGANNVEFDTPPIQLTVGGSTSWVVNSGDTLLSDPFPFVFTGQPTVFAACYGGGSQNAPMSYNSENGDRNYLCNSGEAFTGSTGSYPVWFNSGRLTLGHIRANGTPPPPPDPTLTKVSGARSFAIVSAHAASEELSGARVFALYRFGSQAQSVSAIRTIAPVKRDSPIDISEVRTLAVVRGRVANPKVRAWTFTLDGHDFYVLRLGDNDTLVYDTLSKQWTDWNSYGGTVWRPNIGTTWVGAQKLGDKYGSNIVAGDDMFGLIWFLNPNQGYDDAPDAAYPQQQYPFTRVVTAQAMATGRNVIPCYAIFLDGDNYGLTADAFTASVQLDISDDQGRTFVSCGSIDSYDTTGIANPYQWLSLGQISSPGRIFRITDTGVFTRIDSMGMNDDAG